MVHKVNFYIRLKLTPNVDPSPLHILRRWWDCLFKYTDFSINIPGSHSKDPLIPDNWIKAITCSSRRRFDLITSVNHICLPSQIVDSAHVFSHVTLEETILFVKVMHRKIFSVKVETSVIEIYESVL